MCSKDREIKTGDEEWHHQRTGTIRSRSDLPESFHLYPRESEYFTYAPSSGDESRLGFAVTPYYLSLIGSDEDDPVRRQAIPTVSEHQTLSCESDDPISDRAFSPVERLVHRYRDRALILVTDECAVYCRHCFRRHFASRRRGTLSHSQLQNCIDYLNAKPEVHEVILSGGDPLTLEDGKLLKIIGEIVKGVRRKLVIRLATRVPVVMPQRITPALAEALQDAGTIYVITQFNHRNEITPRSIQAVDELNRAGIPILNQTVLLRGVNDTLTALEELFQTLLEIKVKPYYLFQGDLAAGTSHFRVPLDRGMELYRQLRSRISGLAMPVYAVDLPGGGGKIPLTEAYLDGVIDEGEGEKYRFTGPDGRRYYYPLERP